MAFKYFYNKDSTSSNNYMDRMQDDCQIKIISMIILVGDLNKMKNIYIIYFTVTMIRTLFAMANKSSR
jgi:hypothetical protein